MARTQIPTMFNLAVASVGRTRRTAAIKSKKKRQGKINKIMVTVAVERAADQLDAHEAARSAFARDQRRERDDRESDSHDTPTAVARSVFWERRRGEKQERVVGLQNGVTDEDVGETTVASINRGEMSVMDSAIKPLTPFKKVPSARQRAIIHLTA